MIPYHAISAQGEERPHPWPGYMAAALVEGSTQTCFSASNLTYLFDTYTHLDTDSFTDFLVCVHDGLYLPSASVKLTWATPPSSGDVLVQIRDTGGSAEVGSWRQYVIGLSEVRFTIGQAYLIQRDRAFELFIDNTTDQDLDVDARMSVIGLVRGP